MTQDSCLINFIFQDGTVGGQKLIVIFLAIAVEFYLVYQTAVIHILFDLGKGDTVSRKAGMA